MRLQFGSVLLGLLVSHAVFAHGDHAHGAPLSEKERQAANGVFSDSDVQDRPLSDWDGVWQSIYPYAQDGTLDPVFRQKAEADKSTTFSAVKNYYLTGYASAITEIGIENGVMEFTENGVTHACRYVYQGHKILHYVSGKKGVRYLFACSDQTSAAPKFVQFSDHIIGPRKSGHFHIFTGNVSQDALFSQLENWPTFFPYQLSKEAIVDDLLHH